MHTLNSGDSGRVVHAVHFIKHCCSLQQTLVVPSYKIVVKKLLKKNSDHSGQGYCCHLLLARVWSNIERYIQELMVSALQKCACAVASMSKVVENCRTNSTTACCAQLLV